MSRLFSFASIRRGLAAVMLTHVLLPLTSAVPEGGEVVAGQVTMNQAGGTLNLTQGSDAAIVNWSDFSIGANEIVNVLQNSPDAALLNRVTGADPSRLLGQLNATGRVFLVNPNGVLVGKDARIDAGSFIATTAQISDAGFLAGETFDFEHGSGASIVNLGVIKASSGDAVLVAYRVANQGEIAAPQGTAALGAGTAFVYSPAADSRVRVISHRGLPADGGTGVDNSGLIDAADAALVAADGNIYELAVNQTGVVRATGVTRSGGRVLLTAEGGTVNVEGVVSARQSDGAGGEVLIGGDYQGNNPEVANATRTTIGADALVDVSSTAAMGDGGRVIVWADQQTDFAGTIDGRAGVAGGDGAFAEVSGKKTLNFNGVVDLTAAAGRTGDLLLDPAEVIISTAADDQPNGAFNNSVLATALGTANVTVDASVGDGDTKFGDITVNAPVVWASGNTLTLKAGNTITVNADLTGGSGSTIDFMTGFFDSATITGTLTVAPTATVTAGTVSISLNPDANPLDVSMNEGGGFLRQGPINFQGVLNADILDMHLAGEGVEGDISIANSGNAIGTLRTTSGTSKTVIGAIDIADGSGGLIVDGGFTKDLSEGVFQITTVGDLTLTNGTTLTTFNSDIAVASVGGAFINQAGSGVFTNTISGRTLIYSNNPTGTDLGGLTFEPVYNKTFGGNAPGTITQTGNRVLYSLAPTITFTADDLSRLYGAANPALTFSVTGLVGSDTAAQAFDGTPTLSTTALQSDNVGTAAITIAQNTVTASDYDYQIAFTPGTLTINPAPLTIKADDQTRSFGVANPAFTATFTGLVNGDTSAVFPNLTITTPAVTSSPNGTYAITPAGATNPNYTYTYNPGVLIIGDSIITIRADDLTKLFGSANPTLTGVVTAPSGFDQNLLTNLTYTTTAVQISNVGTYAITPSVDALSGITFNLIDGTLTINPRPLTITALDASRLYGSDNSTLLGNLTGLAPFHTAADITGLTYTTSATPGSNVGTYAITPSVGSNPNYDITLTPGTLTVNPAPLTLTVDSVSKTYGDINPALTATTSGLVLGQSLADLGVLSVSSPVAQFTDAGSYATITAALGSTTAIANNYSISSVPGTFTINPRPASIMIGDISRIYGDANPGFSYSLSGTNPVGMTIASLLDTTGLTLDTTATAASNVGTYAITGSGITDGNFAVTYVPGMLTVNPASLTVAINSTSRAYGAENPTFTATTTGLKLSDTLDAALADSTLSTTATAASNVGTYAIEWSGTPTTSNYSISVTPGTLTVNKAPLSVAPTATTRYYGDANPTPVLTASGLVNGDTVDVVTAFFQANAGPTSSVGNYTYTVTGANATNYEIVNTGTGTLTVLPRPVTITADSFTRVYGDANPLFTATIAGLASFDSADVLGAISFSTGATLTSGVGIWGIMPGGASNPNYAITNVPGQLTITPASLVFNMGGLSRVYGRADEVLSSDRISGLKNNDTFASLGLTVDTPALNADAGTYAVTATVANPNYALVDAAGTFVVTPAPLTIGVDRVVRDYGDSNPTAAPTGVTVNGLAFGQQAADIVTVAFPGDERLDAGTYDFATELFSPNYYVASFSNDFIVRPRHILIKPSNDIRIYGNAPTGGDILIAGAGLASFDTLEDLGDLRVFVQGGIANDERTNVGNYFMHVQAADGFNSNYAVESVPGLLIVAPRPIQIAVADGTMTETSAIPATSIRTSDLASFHTVADVVLNLSFDLLSTDGQTPTFPAVDLDSLVIPERYSDTGFATATGGTDSEVPQVVPGVPEVTFSEIDVVNPVAVDGIGFTIDLRNGLTLNPDGTPQLTDAQREAREPLLTYYWRANFGLNSNYILVGAENGRLDVMRDPAVIAAIDQAEIVRTNAATGIDDFLNPTVTGTVDGFNVISNASSGLYGLPVAAMPAIVDGLRDMFGFMSGIYAAGGGDAFSNDPQAVEIYEFVKRMGSLAGGDDLPADQQQEFALNAFFAALNGGDPEATAIMGGFFAKQVISLVGQDYGSLSSAQRVLVDELSIQLANSRDALAQRMADNKAEYEAQMAERESGIGFTGAHFMRTTPYADFMGDAAAELIQDQQEAAAAAAAVGGTVALGSGAAAGVGVAAASAVIFPFANFAGGGSLLGGGMLAGGSVAGGVAVGSSVAIVAAPVVAVAASVGVIVVGAVSVIQEQEQEALYNDIQNSVGQPMDLGSFSLTNASGEPDAFKQTMLLGAIAAIMGGGL